MSVSNNMDSSMTTTKLIRICRSKGMYDTPELNDSLYLNYEGFEKIENLDAYFNVKSLFLEGNMVTKIENLDKLKNLRGLYLQNNMISNISGLQNLSELNSLDLSNNKIKKIQGLNHLKNLETLNLQNNILSNIDDITELLDNSSMTTLNLSYNKFDGDDGIQLIKFLGKLPNLKSLYLKGNPFLHKIEFYRKHTVSLIRSLTYLDDRPIFDNERRLNDAWINGGPKAEDEERKKISQAKIDKQNVSRKLRREKYEARKNAMFARLEREQKEQKDEEHDLHSNQDDISDDYKQTDPISHTDAENMIQDINTMIHNINNMDLGSHNNDQKEESLDLPGMVNVD